MVRIKNVHNWGLPIESARPNPEASVRQLKDPLERLISAELKHFRDHGDRRGSLSAPLQSLSLLWFGCPSSSLQLWKGGMGFSEKFDDLHRLAEKRTGLTDFGSPDYEERLRLVLSDLDRHGAYSKLGRRAVLAQMTINLTARLIAQKSLTDHPELQTTPTPKPVFIIGTPRSGTTVLHRLIATDPSVQTLPYWLGNAPVPRPPRDQWDEHSWYQFVDQEYVAKFRNSRPDVLDLHPMRADKPEECSWIIEQTFWGAFFFSAMNTPRYTEWAFEADTRPFYEYYRKVLNVVSNGDTRPWVLKNPAHMFAIDALLAVFPNACIVQTHREPVTGLASTSNLIWAMRRDLEPDLTPFDVGEHTLKTWGRGLAMMEESRRRHAEGQFLDVHMLQTRRDPLGTMLGIYEYFDLPVSSDTLSAWGDELERDPNQAHSIGQYKAEDFGVNEGNVRDSIGDYAERYREVCESSGV